MEELEIKQIIKYAYEKKSILISLLLICILVGMFYTFLVKKPIYQVTAQILIDKTDASIEDFVASKDIIKNEKIQVKFNKTNKIITITAQLNKADQAFNLVNQYIENIETKLKETYEIKVFKVIETPQIPQKATNQTYLKDILISVAVAIVIYGVIIILMININGIISATEIENQLGINVLGQVTLEKGKDKKQVISYDSKNKNVINQLKRIEANIALNKENKNPKTICLTANKKNSGNSYITSNLALQYAKLYNKVLIIDTNMGNKTLSNLYAKKVEKGIVEAIKENKAENIEQLINKTEKEHIFILPVGKEVIGEENFLKETMQHILENLKKQYDIILIDTESINEHMYPICISSIADATILVVDANKAKLDDIQKAKNTVEKVDGKMVGVILNKVL